MVARRHRGCLPDRWVGHVAHGAASESRRCPVGRRHLRFPGDGDGGRPLFYWFLKRFALGPLLKLIFRPWAEGLENIPREGAALLASNHLSFSDSVFLPLVVRRRITFPA